MNFPAFLSELHSYNGNDKRYSESKVTEAAKAVDNGNYQESETAADYAMKKLKAHYGVEAIKWLVTFLRS